jgi:uncharacterized protein (DUF1501 family)
MSDYTHADCGCQEYNELSRRNFIVGAAGAAMMATVLPPWLPKVVLAESASSTRDIIVYVFMRGGADGLSLVAPFADANYYSGRPTLAIPRPDSASALKGTALDNMFMFPRGMLGLLPAYQAKELLVVHGAGLSYNSRSHFDAQRFIEVGKAADLSINSGWLGRHLAMTSPMKAGATLRALSISGGLTQALYGGPQTIPIPDPANFAIAGSAATALARSAWLTADYQNAADPLRSSALDVTATLNILKAINITGYVPANAAAYPNSNFGRSLRSAAALIKADIGVEAVQVDIGGWDTHTQEDPLAGALYRNMLDFSGAIGAFWADVLQGNTTYNVTLVAMSEFGRNVRENGNAGTDHGRGGAMFVMGHAIDGGRVLTQNWQPLAKENLDSGQDVKVTVDHRDVLGEIVKNRLNNPALDAIFPGYTGKTLGVTKASAA